MQKLACLVALLGLVAAAETYKSDVMEIPNLVSFQY
jgi:hypothetical protein